MRQFEDWRFTKGAIDAPDEYVDYLLCHHVFPGRLPDEIDELPALTVSLFLTFFMKEQPSTKKRTIRGKRKRRGEY